MRRRILGVAVVAVVIAELVFGVPLAVAVQRLLVSGQSEELEREALNAAVHVTRTPPAQWTRLELDAGDSDVGLYNLDGARIVGSGPGRADAPTASARSGNVAKGQVAEDEVAAVPVFSRGRVVGVVRAHGSHDLLTASVWAAWAGMLLLAGVAALIAAVLARRQAARLTEPLLRLEHGAEELGSGNFGVSVSPSDVGEIDRAADALNRTAARLGDLMAREQNFAAYASHQIQTPLTALRLALESAQADPRTDARATLADSLVTVDRLAGTVDDVLALTRGDEEIERGPLDVPALLADLESRWSPALAASQRDIKVACAEPPVSRAAAAAVRQVLDVLVDNACKHGQGTVTVMARDAGGTLAIDVGDEGTTRGVNLVHGPTPGWPVVSDGRQRGRRPLGLGLARALVAGEGGRLLHAWTQEHTRFTVLLPGQADRE